MLGVAPDLWPRWLRLALVGMTTAVVIAGGWATYRYLAKPVRLTIAAGSMDGEAFSLLSAISARLASSKSHIRLKIVDSGTSLGASEMLAAAKTQLAVVRADTGNLSNARSVLLLTHGAVLILALPTESADSLDGLHNSTIGVIGGEINRPVVAALEQVYQFDRAKVRFQDVAIADGPALLRSGQVHALLVVVPLTEKYLARIRQLFQQAVKGSVPKLIEIESAGAVANVAQYYESYDIPKGTLRGAPPVPSDDLTSLRVSFILVADKSVDAGAITDLTQSLIDVRRDLLSEYPVLAQAGAPSTDADALIPIHPGAATYYNGNQQSFLDKYDDKLYYASLLLGFLVSILLAAWRFVGSDGGPASKLEPLYELGNEIKAARTENELEQTEKKIDDMLKAEFARNATGDGVDGTDMAALSLAAHRLQYLMSHRRTRLEQIPADRS